ncbi:hypothetical protein BDZ97DRAFT_769499 [Flammula alnicola]|nr:hypothetical protein BDZ97DRAFT_769499 [Flammula alnicola]
MSLLYRGGRSGMEQRWFDFSPDKYWVSQFLAVILSKASPAPNLAEILRDHALQFHASSIPADEKDSPPYMDALSALAIASLIYIQECNIPFLEHSHRPETDVCYICLSQEWEDELSVERIPERAEALVPAAPRQLFPLFLFAWFARLVEMLIRDIHHMYI